MRTSSQGEQGKPQVKGKMKEGKSDHSSRKAAGKERYGAKGDQGTGAVLRVAAERCQGIESGYKDVVCKTSLKTDMCGSGREVLFARRKDLPGTGAPGYEGVLGGSKSAGVLLDLEWTWRARSGNFCNWRCRSRGKRSNLLIKKQMSPCGKAGP